jgi:hypothetical protein
LLIEREPSSRLANLRHLSVDLIGHPTCPPLLGFDEKGNQHVQPINCHGFLYFVWKIIFDSALLWKQWDICFEMINGCYHFRLFWKAAHWPSLSFWR